MFKAYYGGTDISSFGTVPIIIERRPSIPGAVPKYTEYWIPGRDGSLIKTDNTVEDIDISVEMALAATPDTFMERYLEAVNELFSVTSKWLKFSDCDYSYKVKYVTMTENNRAVKEAGRFTAVFHCEGYAYGDEEESPELTHGGEYEYYINGVSAHPIFDISASQGTSTITVNGNQVTVNLAAGHTMIDTDLMIAYKYGTTQNLMTSVSGDLSSLWMHHGTNTISVTGGTTRKMYYRERYRT